MAKWMDGRSFSVAEQVPARGAMSMTRKAAVSEDLAANPRYQVFAFTSGVRGDTRDVMVYLPPGYFEVEFDSYSETRRFPVFYLQDGQNLFDGMTSYLAGRTWRAHTTADELAESGVIEPVILVGIANTGVGRMAEYTPTRDFKLGGGEGQSYGQMLMEELKPWVDGEFRTRAGAEDTGLGGSSLGGLITLYLGLEQPEVFGRLAVISPSLWWNGRSIFGTVERLTGKPGTRIWMDMGTAEGARHLRDAEQMYKLLMRLGWRAGENLKYVRAAGAVHDEDAWAGRFGDVLGFLFPARVAKKP